jgi:hypothetical protein
MGIGAVTYLDIPDQLPVIADYSNSVDNNLHEQLDFKDPEEQNAEKHGNTAV